MLNAIPRALNNECELLGPFSIFVQFLMGNLALASLLIKRRQECPKRPFIIWFYDVSKQAIGALVIHFVNLLLSNWLELEKRNDKIDACQLYLSNLILDTTFGVFVLYTILKVNYRFFDWLGVKNYTGSYGSPPQCRIYLKQLIIFLTSLIMMKIIIVLLIHFNPFIAELAKLILSPLEQLHDPRYSILLIMFIAPLFLNMIQFWITDYLLKTHPSKSGFRSFRPTSFSPSSVPLLTNYSSPSINSTISGFSELSPLLLPESAPWAPNGKPYDSVSILSI